MAAGLGYIEFATGDILTAAAANGYLASQVVMVFASASARSSAIASPQEGMISYLKDTNSVEYYSGSAWVAVGGGGATPGLVKLASGTFSGSSNVNPGSYFNTTYKRYKLVMSIYGSVNGADLQMRFRYSGNSASQAANYYGGYFGRDYQSSSVATEFDNQAQATIGRVSSSSDALSIYELTFTNLGQGVSGEPAYTGTGLDRGRICYQFQGGWAGNARSNYDGVEFLPASGTLTGSYTLYGLAD